MTAGLKANADGSGAIQVGGSDAITITSGLNTTFAGTAAVPTGTLYPIVSGTAVASTSGTSIDFTGIPSWVKRITVMLNGVSTNGTSLVQIQIGSGSVVTTGYFATTVQTNATTLGTTNATTGFPLYINNASATASGSLVLTNITGNVWVANGCIAFLTTTMSISAGNSPSLSGSLDRVRITTVNGTDTFDAGSINILYE